MNILLILRWLLFFSILLYYLERTNKVIVTSLIAGFILALVETTLRFSEMSKVKR